MCKTLAAALLALALLPATALARWPAPVALSDGAPVPGFAVGAVDDHARAAVSFPTTAGPRLGLLTADGAQGTIPLAGVDQLVRLRLAADGTVVGAGRTDTGEIPAGEEVHSQGCCWRPVLLRWRPGAATAAVTALDPALTASYDVDDLAVDRAGTAYLAASETPGYFTLETSTLVARFPAAAGAPPEQHALGARTNLLAFAPAVRPGGAVLGWRAPRSQRLLRLGAAGAPLAPRPASLVRARPAEDEEVALAGSGRAVHAFRARGRLWVAVGGAPPRAVAPLAGDERGVVGDRWTLAAGADGTVALASTFAHRVRLRTIDPHGRMSALRDLGAWPGGLGPVVAVDGGGHAHVAWSAGATTLLVADRHGRHVVTTTEAAGIQQLAVSPRGATLLLYGDGQRAFAQLATP